MVVCADAFQFTCSYPDIFNIPHATVAIDANDANLYAFWYFLKTVTLRCELDESISARTVVSGRRKLEQLFITICDVVTCG